LFEFCVEDNLTRVTADARVHVFLTADAAPNKPLVDITESRWRKGSRAPLES
jgi:hypothetical protein